MLFFRYFEDITLTAGVNMDNSFSSESGDMNEGTYSFGSSFTVSWHSDHEGCVALIVISGFAA